MNTTASSAVWKNELHCLVWPFTDEVNWRAHWITAPHLPSGNRVIRLRKRLTLTEQPGLAHLHVCADAQYSLSINGKPVGYGPVRGTTALAFFDTYEVGNCLVSGVNELALEVFSPDYPTFKYACSTPACLLQLEDQSAALLAATATDWEAAVAPDFRPDTLRYTFQMGYSEWRDLRQASATWWEPAVQLADAENYGARQLLPRDVKPLQVRTIADPRVISLFTVTGGTATQSRDFGAQLQTEPRHAAPLPAGWPIVLPVHPEGTGVCLDFGTAYTRGVEIDVSAPDGTVLDIAHGEHVSDKRIRSAPLPDQPDSYRFADRYILKEGRQLVPVTLAERGGRMVDIVVRGAAREVTIYAARAIDRRYPLDPVPHTDGLSTEETHLYNACVETVHACATDTFIDCPWRESAFWVNDTVAEIPIWLALGGDPKLVERCLRLALSQADEDTGLIPAVCPCPSANARRLSFPATNAYFPLMVEAWVNASDDVPPALTDFLPKMQRMLETLWQRRDAASGLLGGWEGVWNFIDWSFPLSGQDPEERPSASLNWFLVLGMQALARMYERVDAPKQQQWNKRAHELSTHIYERLWDRDSMAFREWPNDPTAPCTQLACALALLSKSLPEQTQTLVLGLMNEQFLAPDLFMHFFIFQALEQSGKVEEIHRRIERWWMPAIRAGLPTIPETVVHAPGDFIKGRAFNNAASFCHGFSTAPALWLRAVPHGMGSRAGCAAFRTLRRAR